MKLLFRGFLAALLTALAVSTVAQEFPSKPIRIIVPTSVATTSDLTARFIAEQMSRELKASVIVENKTGSNGILAVTSFLAAAHDGHTLLLTYSGLYANAALYKNVPYDPVKDFRMLGGLNQVLLVLVASTAFEPDTVGQLVDYARQRPNQVTYASSGVGSSTHLGPELLAERTHIKLRHIPYKSGTQAVSDVAAGHVNIAMAAIPTAAPLIASGKLKALAVTGAHRSGLLPETPTLKESGVRAAEITSKQAIVAPAGTPDHIVAKLRGLISRIVDTPAYAEFLKINGVEKEPKRPQDYSTVIPDELKRWAEMVRLSGAQLD